MVPELSRSADHLCQQRINEEVGEEGQSKDLRYEAASYNKGKNTKAAKTTEYVPRG